MSDNLHRPIWEGDRESVNRLLDAGADPNARDARGWTPLSRAIERRQPEIALLLIERGADCLAQDKRRRSPLLWAAQYGPDVLAERLLERGADVIAFDDHSNTPLTQASRHGRTSIVQKLLRHERWSDATGRYWKNYRWTESFFLAIHNHHPHTVAAFLDEGQSVDSTTTRWVHSPQRRCYQPTALMEAIVARDLRIVDLLLRRGADIQKKSQRRSALTEALTHYGKDAALTQTFLDRGATLGLEEAIVTDDLALAERLLTDGTDTEMPDDYGETLLAWAAFQGKPDAVRLLIRFGANPNAPNKYGRSALAGAAATRRPARSAPPAAPTSTSAAGSPASTASPPPRKTKTTTRHSLPCPPCPFPLNARLQRCPGSSAGRACD